MIGPSIQITPHSIKKIKQGLTLGMEIYKGSFYCYEVKA